MLTVNELFAGIGAFRKALIRMGLPHKVVGISEIDRFAIMSYEAIYGEVRNYGDISKVEKLDYADLWTYGFPCQDISLAGKQAGVVQGVTRSGLLYEVERLLRRAKEDGELPKYLIMENVKKIHLQKALKDLTEEDENCDSLEFDYHLDACNEELKEALWLLIYLITHCEGKPRKAVLDIQERLIKIRTLINQHFWSGF
jgi:cytosine-specific methyltransferase